MNIVLVILITCSVVYALAFRLGVRRGKKESWIGYKLHIDAADGNIPVSCVLTSASLHDSQAAIPLATITSERTTNLYDLMDSAYDAPQIHEHSKALGHVPIIDRNPRRNKALKEEIAAEKKRQAFFSDEDTGSHALP